ncbi:MAG: hypothetical protein ACRCXT_04055 [Paraclostridium sp.]
MMITNLILDYFKDDMVRELKLIKKNNKGIDTFKAYIEGNNIVVSNLGNKPNLPIEIFEKIINKLEDSPNKELCIGDVHKYKLGEEGLPIDSLEGFVAIELENKSIGESVFRRSAPIIGILRSLDIIT